MCGLDEVFEEFINPFEDLKQTVWMMTEFKRDNLPYVVCHKYAKTTMLNYC